jgi:cellulose biosynthesis protein BcsQ/gas vesicle protein
MPDSLRYVETLAGTSWIVVGLAAGILVGIVAGLLLSTRKLRRLRAQLAHAQQAAQHEKQAADRLLQQLNEAQAAVGAQMQLSRETRASLEGCVTRRDKEIVNLNSDINRLKTVERQAREARQALEKRVSEREGRIATLISREQEFTEQLHKAAEDYRDLKELYNRADWRILHVAESKGRIWEGEAFGHVPAFRPLLPGAASIVSVMNLKGGVGKSTITANLGAMLWKQGKRVLLIDLDFQGSLTSLCLPPKQVAYLRQDGRMVQKLFAEDRPNLGRLRTCMEPIDRPTQRFKILATDDTLADFEERLMARWLIGKTDADVRFHLRELLHDPTFQRDFDYILLDCPPRRTAASINALACSDFVLVPTLLDEVSMEAAPRLLASLRHLKRNSRICPNVNVLGVLANMVQDKTQLSDVERDRWNRLKVQCQDRWQEPLHMFQTAVPQRKGYGQAAERNQFAVFLSGSDIGDTFTNLAAEVEGLTHRARGGLATAAASPSRRIEDFLAPARSDFSGKPLGPKPR